jgi:two-component system KDP operon response regulator KdpE
LNTVLLVEDDLRIRHFVRLALEREGLRVAEATCLAEARERLIAGQSDMLILDLGLPDGDGVEFIREIRPWVSLPVLVLSARTIESDKVRALDSGADDYLGKPFGVAELLARVRALLRRRIQAGTKQPIVSFGDVVVDLAGRTVHRGGQPLHLTPVEFRLLGCLVSRQGQVITQRQLLNEVWGAGYGDRGHYLRVYVGRLRHKLEADPAQPQHILTETGVGYRFVL